MTTTDTVGAKPERITPSRIAIPQQQLDDLALRLRLTRIPYVPVGVPQLGVPLDLIRSLVQRWQDGFDWSAVEARINRLPQLVREDDDGTRLHAVHLRGAGRPGLPVVLLHGWADTLFSQLDVAERLAAAGHDVVVPSLPGFAFSDQLPGPATAPASARVVHDLMTELGYPRYAVHGGDWGGAVAHALMTTHPESVAAAHLVDIPFSLHFLAEREDLEPHEREFLDAADTRQEEPQYYRLQAGRPLTLAYGMADSPVALLAWLINLYSAWTDREPDPDTVLTQASLYWFTNSFHSSMRFYSEGTEVYDADDADGDEWAVADGDAGPAVPTAFAIHPADIVVPTRSYAERYFAVDRFSLMPAGGHFAAMEVPDALADDIIAFLRARS